VLLPQGSKEFGLGIGQRADLARLAIHRGRPLEVAVPRGDAPADDKVVCAVAAQPAPPPLHAVPLHLALVPMTGDGQWDVHGFSVGFVGNRIGRLTSGLQLSLAVNIIDRELAGVPL
jgi:hypothetical protein